MSQTSAAQEASTEKPLANPNAFTLLNAILNKRPTASFGVAPESAEAADLLEGALASGAQDHERALGKFEDVIRDAGRRLTPAALGEVFALKAQCQTALGDADAATLLQRLLETNAAVFDMFLLTVGETLHQAGRLEDAMLCLTRYREVWPLDQSATYKLGRHLLDVGDIEGLIALIDDYEISGGDHPSIAGLAMQAALQYGLWPSAEGLVNRSLRKYPRDLNALFSGSTLGYLTGNPTLGASRARRIAELHPGYMFMSLRCHTPLTA
jgi:tetratricopeptide (TPR) repeat protein